MNKVVIDLEFCPVKREYKDIREKCMHEIIQVGAVKLDNEDEIIDSFNLLVKPRYGIVTKPVERLTHISENMLEKEGDFTDVLDLFLDWVGEEKTEIYSWSETDYHQLVEESMVKSYENERLSVLFLNWKDLQKMISKKLGFERMLSLKDALLYGDIGIKGTLHSADADAYNTAVLYQLFKNDAAFVSRFKATMDAMTHKEPLTFSLGSVFGEALLKSMAG